MDSLSLFIPRFQIRKACRQNLIQISALFQIYLKITLFQQKWSDADTANVSTISTTRQLQGGDRCLRPFQAYLLPFPLNQKYMQRKKLSMRNLQEV